MEENTLEIVASYCTDVGNRKKVNQDSLCLKSIKYGEYTITMAVVCDGMGGLEQGEVASASVIRAFVTWFDDSLPELCREGLTFKKVKEQWNKLVLECNEQLILYGDSMGKKLGTTLTAVLIADEQGMYVLHVGDCRLYEIKNEIRQLTEDQTLVELQVKRGLLTREQAKRDPRQNIILQCIGDTPNVKFEEYLFRVEHECTYLICSDGFRHKISEQEMQTYLSPLELSKEEKIYENARFLVDLCKSRKEQDNISVIVIRTL